MSRFTDSQTIRATCKRLATSDSHLKHRNGQNQMRNAVNAQDQTRSAVHRRLGAGGDEQDLDELEWANS